ncbi:MAG: MoxR family ATPase [Spirochaetes bacterium]|nr:MoxR family ATPase [Spirochaetota bacterium]
MDYAAIEKMTSLVKEKNSVVDAVKKEMGKVIFGQNNLIDRILISFFCDGHILVEGLPGLAKTLTVRSFAKTLSGHFNRIQFTPDILPADLIGTRIYNPKDMEFFTKKGPIFCNILLADEINRAPAKVQSALLQAMEEKNVTIGEDTYKLESPFMVLATENPIEQEGTYPLPEAQLDRFFMKVLVSYPDRVEELDILKNYGSINTDNVNNVITLDEIADIKNVISGIYVDDKLNEYIVNIVSETRKPANADVAQLIDFGASPRASIALMKASRAVAFMKGRGFVTPEDIKEIGADILRHRIILSYEAEAEDITTDDAVKLIFDSVEVP